MALEIFEVVMLSAGFFPLANLAMLYKIDIGILVPLIPAFAVATSLFELYLMASGCGCWVIWIERWSIPWSRSWTRSPRYCDSYILSFDSPWNFRVTFDYVIVTTFSGSQNNYLYSSWLIQQFGGWFVLLLHQDLYSWFF